MADVNNKNGVFGGIQFNKDVNGIENTSYFDGINTDNLYGYTSVKGNGNTTYSNEVTENGSLYSNSNSGTTNNSEVYGNLIRNAGNVYGNYGNKTNNNSGMYNKVVTNAGSYNGTLDNNINYEPVPQDKAIVKQGIWSKIRALLFKEIDLNAKIQVELTPYQQKVENEINDFLHQEVSFKGIAKLFKGKK